MSQIFDALQRSEADRSGIDRAELSAAAELLEIAERQVVHFSAESDCTTDNEPKTGNEHQPEKLVVDQFSQFRPVQVLVSPHSKLVCVTDEHSLAAENFRFLSVRLRHLQQRRSLKRLLITSSMAEEGKSMIAANLGCTLAAKQGQKTLLIEGDLRRPGLAQQFGLGTLPGLCDLLQGKSSSAMNIYHLESLDFWILPAGHPQTNPLELMQSGKLSVLMDQLAGWFDWIVIDSPPVLPLADASVWMRLADGILLVTRPGTTAKRQLRRALEAVEQSKLLGALVNGSREAALDDYYYHHYAARTTVPQITG